MNTSPMPPLRLEHRFSDTMWQPSTAAFTDSMAAGTWPPQGQFIQQLPPAQMNDFQYHAPTMLYYSPATPVTTGYRQAQQQQQSQPSSTATRDDFKQSNGSVYRETQSVPSSSSSSEFAINSIYNSKENNLVSQPATSTPNGGCSFSDTINASSSISPSASKTSAIRTNEENAISPVYTTLQPSRPQLMQNLYDSSGYPSHDAQSVSHGGDTQQYQRSSPTKVSDDDYRVEDSTNADNKFRETMMREKQSDAAVNYYPPSSNGAQFATDQKQPRDGQFYTPTPPPLSPLPNQQHYQFSLTHTSLEQQQQAQHELRLQHQMHQQQQQMRQDEQVQQMNHQYRQQQQQFHQQQQIQMQQQQQQQNTIYQRDGSLMTTEENSTSSTRNCSTLDSQHQQTYSENYEKRNESSNFFATGHHPRGSSAEGGGYWNAAAANNIQLDKSNEFKEEIRYRELPGDIANGKQVQNINSDTNEANFAGGNTIDENGVVKKAESMKKSKSNNFHDGATRRDKNASGHVEEPTCDCFPADKVPAEPGSYYTHLGSAATLADLRDDFQRRTGLKNDAIRFEKILYTGKEGKTTQGCPLAKWIIRRASTSEKILVIVKHRQGHRCSTAWIVVVMVVWEGVPRKDADFLFDLLTDKLNRYGVPTMRRCATNESRSCACQGLDPETNGASFSFGCSWSMYYNGCKYARSKSARKFRLSVRSEEMDIEQRINDLATYITPIYRKMAPRAFKHMTAFEDEASACRLGSGPGRPFSGVTACVDFCAHSHRDMNNMNNGLTCEVTLSKQRYVSEPQDEQLHVLPLYTIDETDEFGSKENQKDKIKNGSIEILNKYECEIKVRTIPLKPCRRRGKKHEDDDIDSIDDGVKHRKNPTCRTTPDSQVQSSQVSSTVLDSPHHPWQPSAAIASDALRGAPLLPSSPFANFNVYPHTAASPYSLSNFTNRDLSSEPLRWTYNDAPESHRATPYSPSAESCLTRPFPTPLPVNQNCVSFDKYSNDKQTSSIVSPVPRRSALSVVNVTDPYCKPSESINASYWPKLPDIPHFAGPSPVNSLAPPYSIPIATAFPPSPYLSPLASYPPSFYPHENTPPTFNNYQTFSFASPVSPFVPVERPQIKPIVASNLTRISSNLNSQVDGSSEVNNNSLGSVVGWSSNEECFKDSQMGGVAISLSHGAILFECAKNELHSTTALKNPNRRHPSRIGLVFYQHRNLNLPKHGQGEWAEKIKTRKFSQEPIKSSSSNANVSESSSPTADNKFLVP